MPALRNILNRAAPSRFCHSAVVRVILNVPPDFAEDDLLGQVKKHWQLNSIDRMLEECGKQMDQAAERAVGQADVHDELGRALAGATTTATATATASPASILATAQALPPPAPPPPPSPALQAWAGESYRCLRAVLLKGDPQLLRTGLVQARAAPDFWVAPKNAAAFEAARASELLRSAEQRGAGSGRK